MEAACLRQTELPHASRLFTDFTYHFDRVSKFYRYQFESDFNAGALSIEFEDPPARFVVSPNSPVRQVWVSALTRSFKLEWDDSRTAFVLPETKQTLTELIQSAIAQHTGEEVAL